MSNFFVLELDGNFLKYKIVHKKIMKKINNLKHFICP